MFNSVSDLQLDAVELVKAGPRARLREALEELAHRLVVEAVGAVEDDTLQRETASCTGMQSSVEVQMEHHTPLMATVIS